MWQALTTPPTALRYSLTNRVQRASQSALGCWEAERSGLARTFQDGQGKIESVTGFSENIHLKEPLSLQESKR